MNFNVLYKFLRSGPELETLGFRYKAPITYQSFLMVIAIFVFSILPIVWYKHLPLADYPNHLATIQIRKMLPSDPYLSKFFEFHWVLTPYSGFDLLTFPFVNYLSIEIVGKIAIIAVTLIIYVGTILLDRQLNHDNWGLSLFSGIFFYGGAFKFGFITYLVGVGFAIWAFWIWVRYREKANGPWLPVFVLSGGLVLAMHLYAFGIYSICVGGYECSLLWERLRVEGRLRTLLFRIPFSAAVSLITPLLVLWFSPIATNPRVIIWGHAPGFWAALAWKVEGLASPIFYCDAVFEVPLLLIILVLFVWGFATRTIIVNSRMVIPLGAFAAIFVIMPFTLLGSSYADYRLPSAVAFITLASLGWRKASPARINLVRLLLTVCLIVRVGAVFADWLPAQAMIAEYDGALRLVPPGSRLLVIVGSTFWGDRKPPLRYIPTLAAAMQGVFDPHTFTAETTPIGLNFKPDYRDYWTNRNTGPSRVSDFKRFDYLLKIRQPSVKIPAEITLAEIERGQTFVLYRIEQLRLPSIE